MKISVFGSASAHPESPEFKDALNFGVLAATAGWSLSCGAYKGIMLATAMGAKSAGGSVTGVAWKGSLLTPNEYLSEIITVDEYIDRSRYLIMNSNVYVFFPGGTGTLMELSIAWALLERNLLERKLIITIGEEWRELVQLISFYNENSFESGLFIHNVANSDEAIELIKQFHL